MNRMVKLMQLILLSTFFVALVTGCGKDEIEYGSEIGIVSGNVDLSNENPEITLTNIKSYVGEEIDYLSGIIIGDIDAYEEMETWVDASLVDIFTPGDYKATYTFKYGDKEYTKDIVVTIIERENGGDSTDYIQNAENESNTATDSGYNNNQNQNLNDNQSNESNTPLTGENSQVSSTAITQNTSTNLQQGSNSITNTAVTTKVQSGNNGNTNQQTTTHRQIITSAGSITTEYKELGYYSIELLSGKTVKLKSTTSKYIVSTHTDISNVTKNDIQYKVSKLIVAFSDGTTQVLETVEEKIQ